MREPIIAAILIMGLSFAQTSGMQWLGATERSLGVFFFTPESTVTIRDTIRFINTLSEPLEITKLHVHQPERFSCTWHTAPGKTGEIRFEHPLRMGSLFMDVHEVRLNVQTRTWPWEMVILHFVTVQGMKVAQYHPDGKPSVLHGLWQDGQPLRQELWLRPNGQPLEAGMCSHPGGQRLGTWKRWDNRGFPRTDTTYLMPLSLHLYLPGGGLAQQSAFQLYQSGQPSQPWGYGQSGAWRLWLPSDADSLLIRQDSLQTTLDLSWFLHQNQPYASVPLLPANQPTLLINHIPMPLVWNDSAYGILWEEPITKPEVESQIHALRAAYPYLRLNTLGDGSWYLIPPPAAEDPELTLFPDLCSKFRIHGFSLCLSAPFGAGPAWFTGQVSFQVIAPVSPKELAALAESYGCTLEPVSPGAGFWAFRFTGPLTDDGFVKQVLNRLPLEPWIGMCSPQVTHFVPVEPDW